MCNEPDSFSTANEVHARWGAGIDGVIGVSAARVRHMIGVRKLRGQLISESAFADPAWDILLEAFAGSLEEIPCSATDLTEASGVPESTANRWISKLVADALMEPAIGTQTGHYKLTLSGYLAMRNYFETVGLPI